MSNVGDRVNFEYVVLIDTREKELKHITDKFEANNISVQHIGLVVGDYRIQATALDGNQMNYSPRVVIERKANLNELIANLLGEKDQHGKTRLHRELQRSLESKTKLIIMIEELDWYNKLLRGDYISQVNPKAIRGMIMSLEAKYHPYVSIVGIDKSQSASYIHTTLYYHLRQELKRFKELGSWEL